jgi:hypothetical protein
VNIYGVLLAAHEVIGIMSHARESLQDDDGYAPLFQDDLLKESNTGIRRALKAPADMALHLYLLASKYADRARQEEMCYEFFVQVFLLNHRHLQYMKNLFRNLKLSLAQ